MSQEQPSARVVMRQRWHDLLFLHWPIDPAEIQRLMPPGLIVDTFNGQAYVALVPFRMTGVTPAWFAPTPCVSDFLECNVRTYARRASDGAPGVWFFSLDAGNPLAVAVARAAFALPYFFAQMNQSESRYRMDGKWTKRIDYSTRRIHPGAQVGGCRVIYEPGAAPRLAANDPLEAFLIERYRLFAFRRSEIWTGMVRHQPYEVRSAKVVALEETLLFAAGVRRPDIEPLVHYAREVIVDIGPLEH